MLIIIDWHRLGHSLTRVSRQPACCLAELDTLLASWHQARFSSAMLTSPYYLVRLVLLLEEKTCLALKCEIRVLAGQFVIKCQLVLAAGIGV